jgi:outer membrane protein OmpA-like peptidoglycan-associated protein
LASVTLLGCRGPARDAAAPPSPPQTTTPPAPARLPIVGIPAHTLFFAKGSAKLDLNAQVLLDGVAEVMRAEPTRRLMVEGHTDETTEKKQSQTLAQRRARAVVTYLVQQHGLPEERFQTAAIGHVRPLAPPEVPGGTARNRRVEFWWAQ